MCVNIIKEVTFTAVYNSIFGGHCCPKKSLGGNIVHAYLFINVLKSASNTTNK